MISTLPIGYQIDRFQIESILGKGGFGITYLAVDTQIGLRVAIKELLPDTIATRAEGATVIPQTESMWENWQWARDRFVEEAQILAGFSHPAIVGIHSLMEANGTVYMVMDLVDGESYESRLKRIGCEADQESLMQIFEPILDGLQEVHSKELLHRDIKPENILIGAQGQPVLIDFGSARTSIGATMTMTSIVTHGYSPIEQYQTKGRMGPWTDIYALGAVMCRAITGEKPPVAADRLMGDEFAWLSHQGFPGFDSNFLRNIDWALRLKPEERPQGVAAWREQWAVANSDHPAPSQVLFQLQDTYKKWDTGNSYFPSGVGTSARSESDKISSPPPLPTSIKPKTEPLSIWSLVLGILSILGCSVGGVILAIPGVLCGHFGMASIKKHAPREGYGYAFAGLVLGYAAIGITLLAIPLLLPAISGATKRAEILKEQQQKELKSAEYLNAVEQLEKDVHKIFDEVNNPTSTPLESSPKVEEKPVGDNETQQFLALMREFFNDLSATQKDYEAALEKAGLDSLFDPDRMAADQGFVNSRRILSNSNEAVEIYRNQAIQLFADFPKKLDNYNLSQLTKETFIDGYRRGIEKSGPLIKESWDLEVQCVDIMEQLLNHLETNRARWSASDGLYLFERDADLDKFNALLDQLNSSVERQEEIKRLSQAESKKSFEKIKKKVQP